MHTQIHTPIQAQLSAALPHWHFEPYGTRGAVACFPPNGPSLEAWRELEPHAFISSVCGPLYVVTTLRNAKAQEGEV